MLDTKSPFQSLTINASVIALVVQLLAIFGVQIAPETAVQIGTSLNAIISAVAILVAIYGRWTASKRIAPAADAGATLRCSPIAVGVLMLGVVFLSLAGCATTGTRVAAPNAGAPVAFVPVESSGPGASGFQVATDTAVRVVEAAAAAVDAGTEAAIANGMLNGTAAIEARERADQVRMAMLIARGVASVFGAPTAQDRILAALTLAANAQAYLAGPPVR